MRSSRLLVLLFGMGCAKAVGCSTGMSPARGAVQKSFRAREPRPGCLRRHLLAVFRPRPARPQTARSRRTNSPLELPEALRGKGQTPKAGAGAELVCRVYAENDVKEIIGQRRRCAISLF